MANFYIDDDDLTSLGWRVVATAGLDDPVGWDVPTVALPSRRVSVIGSTEYQAAPRVFSVTLAIRSSSAATLETALAVLRSKLGPRTVAIRHLFRTNLKLVARCTGGSLAYGQGPQYVSRFYFQTDLQFTADDPFWRDITNQSVNFGTSATALPQGTADTEGIIRITASGGSVVNPYVDYKSSGGTLLAQVDTVHTILNGDAIEFDVETGRVQKRVSGVWSDVEEILVAGFTLPVFSPRDGVYATSTWPTIQLGADSGSANAQGNALYPRKFE